MSDTTFKAICNFTTSLSELFAETYRPLKLYCYIISRTKTVHQKPIEKHIQAFRKFCVENREAILSKDVDSLSADKISYSERVYIDIKEIIKVSDEDTRDVIWQHILTISALTDPENNAKEALKEEQKPRKAILPQGEGGEANFLSGLMSSVEEHVDPDINNPMEAVSSIMKSGVFTDLIQNMTEGFSNGSLNMGKLMGEVGNMVGQMSSEAGDSEGGKEAMNMLNTMMGGLANPNQAGGDEPNLAGMMSGVMGNMMGGGAGGMPDIGGMMSGGGSSIDDRINAQVEQAKKKGDFGSDNK